MKKGKVIIIVAVLFLIGIFSITMSSNDFFLTTKYYETPLDAYNADSAYSAIHGETKADREIGVFMLDEKMLFLSEK